jgi:multiple sugar transport system permease protein
MPRLTDTRLTRLLRRLRLRRSGPLGGRQVPGRAPAVLCALVLVGFAAFFAGPIVWLLLAPTKTGYELATRSPFAFGSFHTVAATWHELDSFDDHVYRRWLENSLLYSFGATGLTLATALPAGYGLAIGRFRGRKLVLTATMISMLMPATALALPTFLELNALHLLGSMFSVVLPFAFFPFGVYLVYLYYSTAVPAELIDAARIDGCGEWQAFRRVALPLAKPAVALVFFFAFVADWTNFFLSYIVLGDSRQFPVQVGLNDMLLGAPRPMLALAALIAAVPVALVFVLMQRALVRGLLSGATAG